MSGVKLGGRESDLTIPESRVWFGHHDTAPLRFSFTVFTPWIVDCVVYVVVDALECGDGDRSG